MAKLTEKQIAKRKAKAEREEIVKQYIDKIQEIIDDGYLYMTEELEIFNKQLQDSSIEYGTIEAQVQFLLKAELMPDDKIEELMNKIAIMEIQNDELYTTITSRSMESNKLLKHLPSIAEKVGDVIVTAEKDLQNHKNKAYIVSMVINRSMEVFKSYNKYIIDTALEANDYIDMYIDARENFLDFIQKSKDELEQRIKSDNHSDVVIEENIKYNQRLRVDYTDLCNFLKHKGYECNRQGSTTHAVWKHIRTGHSVPLPNKSGTIPQGTTSKVLKQIGSNRNELAQYLYS